MIGSVRSPSFSSTRTSSATVRELDIESDFMLLSHKTHLLPSILPYRHKRATLNTWLLSRAGVLWRGLRRQPKSLTRQMVRYVCLTVICLFIVTPVYFPSYSQSPEHYRALRERCLVPNSLSGCANLHNEKVFIAASLFDPTGSIARGQWAENVLDLIHMIGEDNVFLSIYENDSGELGASALDEFESKVPCRHTFVNEPHVEYSDFPHITMPDGTRRLKRLAYLSEMRNRALYPLDRFTPEGGIVEYDRVLFLNDALFRPVDAAHLLFSTNTGQDGRAHYLSACAVDYDHSPFLMYDLFAQRDAEGFSNGLPIFPYFSTAGNATSRKAMMSQTDAVQVKSCWAGMVAMQARWVQNMQAGLPSEAWQTIAHHVINPDRPHNVTAPVRFRYEPDIYVEACECCLFLADVSTVAENAGAADLGVYVNPYVRVSYSRHTLLLEPLVRRWERLFSLPQAIITPLINLPTHNPHREVREGDPFTEEVYLAREGWTMVERVGRNGMFCEVREMQLVVEGPRDGRNWESINNIPWRVQKLDFPP